MLGFAPLGSVALADDTSNIRVPIYAVVEVTQDDDTASSSVVVQLRGRITGVAYGRSRAGGVQNGGIIAGGTQTGGKRASGA